MGMKMVELIQANLQVDGREGVRCYCVSLRWSNGLSSTMVVFENEFPKKAKQIQDIIDATKEMTVTQRLSYIQEQINKT